jgi:hypothetical protein
LSRTIELTRGDTAAAQVKSKKTTPIMEMNINGYTGDDFAKLRAKRILLNEQIETGNLWNRGSRDLGMIEHTVRAGNKVIEQIYCPLPIIYQEFKDDTERFLVTAKLMCVLFLKINRVVQHIFTLKLQMNDLDEVSIVFEGQRHRQYVNQEPKTIQLSGSCKLNSQEK